jgi:hypothetical protein
MAWTLECPESGQRYVKVGSYPPTSSAAAAGEGKHQCSFPIAGENQSPSPIAMGEGLEVWACRGTIV